MEMQRIEKEEFLPYEQPEEFKNIKYVEREEDQQLKALYEAEIRELKEMGTRLKGRIDGEIDMDLHGNITFRSAN